MGVLDRAKAMPRSHKDYLRALAEISTFFVNFRLDRDLSQKELADILEISQPMLSKIEKAESNISLKALYGYLDKLDCRLKLEIKSYEIEKKQNILRLEGFFKENSSWDCADLSMSGVEKTVNG